MVPRSVYATLMLLLAASGAAAQTVQVGAGHRVRVTTKERQLIGIVRSVDGGSISMIEIAGDSVVVAPADVRGIEVSAGWRSNKGRGARIGAGMGLAAGVVLGALPRRDASAPGAFFGDDFESLETMGRILTYGFAGSVAGAVVGYAIGSRSTSELWLASDTGRPLAYVAPGRFGLQLAF